MVRRGQIRTVGALSAVLVFLAVAVAVVARSDAQPVDGRSVIAEGGSDTAGTDEISERRLLDAYAGLPLSFVKNRGQTDGRVRYVANGARYGFFLTADALVMSLLGPDGVHGVALSLGFVGADPDVTVEPSREAPGKVSYLRGADPAGWLRGLSSFGEVLYRELWPGIDLAVRGRGGELKYEFRVRPGRASTTSGSPTGARIALFGTAGAA